MRLGIIAGTWDGSPGEAAEILAVALEAERCDYDIVWVPELYGADAVSLMSWLGSHTSTIRIGSAVMQIPAWPATTTAMSAATLACLYGPRIVLGLGVSGPQVSEGWYGQAWEDPIGRTREYIEVLRLALQRSTVRHDGDHIRLPLREGQRALKLVLKDPPEVPVMLAAIGPRNVALAAALCDGWLPALVMPEHFEEPRRHFLDAAVAAGRDPAELVVACSTAAVINDDIRVARDVYRPYPRCS